MPARKRAAPESIDTPRRTSRRISSTPGKSQYFESSDEDANQNDEPPRKRGRPPKNRQSLKKDDSEKQYKEKSESESESAEEDESEEQVPPPRKRGRPSKAKQPLKKKEEEEQYEDESEKQEDEDEEEDDEDGPMKVTVIPLEKMRDTGGVEYEDEKVHKNTFLFLKDLKANNKRPWLKSHDGEYRRAWKDWQSFVESTTETIIEADETIPELPAKDLLFRIYRDIRFSKNPTPYKAHFSAAWSRTGRKGPYACYYIHCEPKASFIGGGLWCPEAGHIHKLRASIDERPNRWRRVLNDPAFKRTFLPGVKADAKPEAALKAFAEKNQSNALKTKPKGFTVEHRDIELLKLRNFTVGTKISDDIFLGDDAQEKISAIIQPMVVFVSPGIIEMHAFSLTSATITFLNSIVMPDPGDDDDDDDEEDEDEEEEEELVGDTDEE